MCSLFLSFPTAMPLTFEAINTICAHLTVDQAYPFPAQPFTRHETFALLSMSTATARLWLGDPQHGVPAVFSEPNIELHDIALSVVERDAHLVDRIKGQAAYLQPFYPREGERFARTWGMRSDLHSTRHFIRVRQLDVLWRRPQAHLLHPTSLIADVQHFRLGASLAVH